MYWFDIYNWLIQWVEETTKFFTAKQKYELINTINAWELNSMYEAGTEKLEVALFNAPFSLEQFKKEIDEKNLGSPEIILSLLDPKKNIKTEEPIFEIKPNTIIVKNSENKIEFSKNERINELLDKFPEKDVISLLVRYRTITLKEVTSSYQWAYPQREGAEAFASPINVSKFPTEAVYCSAFEEDKKFNSLGSFFKLEDEVLQKYKWHINPPFTEMILEAAARKALDAEIKFTFVMPYWLDSKAYILLKNQQCFRRILKKREHYYEDPEKKIKSTFNTILFECD